ncbi:MAG: acyl carrier protein [Acutalibacteraceae bacterium]|nr:acyl carrier protein [Acutalibacteraceae bacterium]
MLDIIKEIICGFVDVEPEDITEDSRLTTDLGLCSLDLAMLSTELEREFGVSVTAKTFATVKTVGGLMDYIKGII